jgi:hypothetical protein
MIISCESARCFWLVALIIGSITLQGCDNTDAVADAKKYFRKIIERLLPGGDGDVYKPIREGRVELVQLPNGPELITWGTNVSKKFNDG